MRYPGEAIGDRFDPQHNNFDVIRVLAAATVIISHSFPLLGKPYEPFARYLGNYDTGGGLAVAVFFVISGFLICRSCLERPIQAYLVARCLRIVPALAVLVLLGMFLVGPVFTTLPLDEYFAAAGTYEHLLNISIFFQHTGLPGVFWGGPVNGTIWTLPSSSPATSSSRSSRRLGYCGVG